MASSLGAWLRALLSDLSPPRRSCCLPPSLSPRWWTHMSQSVQSGCNNWVIQQGPGEPTAHWQWQILAVSCCSAGSWPSVGSSMPQPIGGSHNGLGVPYHVLLCCSSRDFVSFSLTPCGTASRCGNFSLSVQLLCSATVWRTWTHRSWQLYLTHFGHCFRTASTSCLGFDLQQLHCELPPCGFYQCLHLICQAMPFGFLSSSLHKL
jgi:hypothetical protein